MPLHVFFISVFLCGLDYFAIYLDDIYSDVSIKCLSLHPNSNIKQNTNE